MGLSGGKKLMPAESNPVTAKTISCLWRVLLEGKLVFSLFVSGPSRAAVSCVVLDLLLFLLSWTKLFNLGKSRKQGHSKTLPFNEP